MQVVVRLLNLGLGVFVTALVVRTLGQAGYGQWSTIFIVLGLVGYFANFGTETVAVREAAGDAEHEHEWIGAVLMLRLLMLGPVIAVSIAALVLIEKSHEMLVAGLILIVMTPFSGASVVQLVFRLRVNNLVPMLVLTLRSVLWGAAVAFIYWHGGGMVALAIAMTATTAAAAIVQLVLALRVVDRWPTPSRRRLGHLVRVSLPVGISGVLVIAYARIDQLLVFEIAGSKAAGLYGSVYNVLEQAHFIPISILTTLAPIIAASWPSDRPRMLRATRLAAELLAIASFGGVAFTVVAATPVVRLIFGSEFVAAAPALPVLATAFVFICVGYLTGNLMVVLGLQNRMLFVSLAALLVNVAGNFAFIPVFGFMAAAWMTTATEIVVSALTIMLILRALEMRLPAPGRVGRTALAALILCGGLALLSSVGASLWVLVVATAVCYPGLLFGLRSIGPDDIRVLLRRGASV